MQDLRSAGMDRRDNASHAVTLELNGAAEAEGAGKAPAVIAREVIRKLARDRLPPTPENFSRVYESLSGPGHRGQHEHVAAHSDLMTRAFIATAAALPATPAQREALKQAIGKGAWHAVDSLLDEIAAKKQRHETTSAVDGKVITQEWSETSVVALGCSAPLYKKAPQLKRMAENLVYSLRQINGAEEHEDVRESVKGLATQLASLQHEEDATNLQLKSLLSAIVKNVAGLNEEHSWLNGQMTKIDIALKSNADSGTLRNIESTLRDAGRRQEELRRTLDDAKQALREMISVFMSRLGEMADSTNDFTNRVTEYAVAIENADDVSSVTQVVQHLLQDTRNLHGEMKSAKEKLAAARHQAQEQDGKMKSLESELIKVSELVRTDQLTRALNLNGLQAAYEDEVERAREDGSSLCLTVLDVDNFKSLNERHGHEAGNDALVHLSRIVREALRPTDVLARLGGEEFVILMPDTPVNIAVGISEKLQRQLTRQFFLHGLEKLFVTFSAGVTRVAIDEPQQAAIDRAGKALAHAKRLGKNRVCAS
jgi:diguanylate cyclase